jgi:hypothetical protein
MHAATSLQVGVGQQLLFFGGGRTATLTNGVSAFDTAAAAWRPPLAVSGRRPGRRQNAACAPLPGTSLLMVFGGYVARRREPNRRPRLPKWRAARGHPLGSRAQRCVMLCYVLRYATLCYAMPQRCWGGARELGDTHLLDLDGAVAAGDAEGGAGDASSDEDGEEGEEGEEGDEGEEGEEGGEGELRIVGQHPIFGPIVVVGGQATILYTPPTTMQRCHGVAPAASCAVAVRAAGARGLVGVWVADGA